MPSTRNQRAREKRSRQTDAMSDFGNLDVMLESYSRNAHEEQGEASELEIDLESREHQQSTILGRDNFRSLFNTNESENSEILAETGRAINSEISSQMSRKLEEIKSDLNSHILEVISSAFQEKVLPSIENALKPVKISSNTKWDVRSEGLHSSKISQEAQQSDLKSDRLQKSKTDQRCQQHELRSDGLQQIQIDQAAKKCDLRSNRLHPSENTKMNYKARLDFPRANSRESNRNDHC